MQSCHFIGLAFTVVAAGETQQKALLQKWLIAAGSLLFPMQVDLSWIFFNVPDSAIPPRQGTRGTARHWNLAGRGVNSFGASGFKIHSGENRYSGTGNQGQLPGFTGAMIPPRFTQPA
jgi:hypothetical protein